MDHDNQSWDKLFEEYLYNKPEPLAPAFTFQSGVLQVIFMLVFPSLNFGTIWAVRALSYEMKRIATERVERQLQDRRAQHLENRQCCAELYRQATPAPVFLLSSSIDSSATSAAFFRGSHPVKAPLALQQGFHYLAYQSVFVAAHWSVVVRGTVYDLIREEGMRVKLRKFPFEGDVKTDAAGIRLTPTASHYVGVTFLADEDIESLLDQEEMERKLQGKGHWTYNLIDNNCQHLWTDGLLARIVCQCSGQPRMLIPGTIGEMFDGIFSSNACTHLYAAFLIALSKRGYLGLSRLRVGPWSSLWIYSIMQISKPFILRNALATPDVAIHAQGRRSSVELSGCQDAASCTEADVHEVQEIHSAQPDRLVDEIQEGASLSSLLTSQRLLRGLVIAVCVLEPFIGMLHRFHDRYMVLEWADFLLGHVCYALLRNLRKQEERATLSRRSNGCLASGLKGFTRSPDQRAAFAAALLALGESRDIV